MRLRKICGGQILKDFVHQPRDLAFILMVMKATHGLNFYQDGDVVRYGFQNDHFGNIMEKKDQKNLMATYQLWDQT